MFIYEYEVVYYNDVDFKNYHVCGYLIAEDYKEAMDNMIQHFGDDKIVNVRLKAIAEDRVIVMKEEKADREELGNWAGPAKNEWC